VFLPALVRLSERCPRDASVSHVAPISQTVPVSCRHERSLQSVPSTPLIYASNHAHPSLKIRPRILHRDAAPSRGRRLSHPSPSGEGKCGERPKGRLQAGQPFPGGCSHSRACRRR
ncbi:unnamed protein product, partial [Ectocarpus fasciculatus]